MGEEKKDTENEELVGIKYLRQQLKMSQEQVDAKKDTGQLRFLSQSSMLEESSTPFIIQFTVWSMLVALITFLIWATYADVKEVVKADGNVIPAGSIQTVQHLQGGVIQEIYVSEGEEVLEGQKLLKISGDDVKTELQKMNMTKLSLLLKAERIRAFVHEDEYDFSIIPKNNANMISKQKELLKSMTKAHSEEKSVLRKQLKQKMDFEKILLEKLKTLKKNITLARESFLVEKAAFEGGISLKGAYLSAQTNYNSILGEAERLKKEIQQSQESIREYEYRLNSFDAGLRDRYLQELSDIDDQLYQIKESRENFANKVKGLIVKSPVKGIVNGLEVKNKGMVVSPGMQLMEIVPTGDQLLADVKIMPQDIGHVFKGAEVTMKVTAYDFARYGTIDGIVSDLSANTFTSPKGGPSFYKGKITIKQSFVGHEKNRILPGMTIQSSIITGNKTVMEYLLKPIHVSLTGAFSER